MALCGCAKPSAVSSGDAAKRYFEAFVHNNYPQAAKTPLGAYVIEEEAGTGKALGDTSTSPYVLVEYIVSDLEGNIASTTYEEIAHRVGLDTASTHFGPTLWCRSNSRVYAGLEESLKQMKVGGRRKVIIPGWLFTFENFTSAREYEEKVTGTSSIYDFRVVDGFKDIVKWEIDSMANYLSHNFPKVSPRDSAAYGYYYIEREAPTDTARFHADSTFYINYIGRLLDGTVFDTNIKDTAKFYGIYKPSGSYKPSAITYDSDNYVYKMGDNNVITGFSMTLARMRAYGKSTAVFYSTLGYGTAGSGLIPAFAPLRFDIDVVDVPKK